MELKDLDQEEKQELLATFEEWAKLRHPTFVINDEQHSFSRIKEAIKNESEIGRKMANAILDQKRRAEFLRSI